MNFGAKSIKMPGKRQRADAYRGLTYLELNADKGTQQIIQGEGRGRRIVSLTRKSSVERKRPENACVRVTSVSSTQLCRAPSRGVRDEEGPLSRAFSKRLEGRWSKERGGATGRSDGAERRGGAPRYKRGGSATREKEEGEVWCDRE